MTRIVPYASLRDELNRLFYDMERDWLPSLAIKNHGANSDEFNRRFLPAVDVIDKPKELLVKAAIPGLKPGDVELSVENNILTIHGKSEAEKEEKTDNYYHREISSGSYYRQLKLPAEVSGDKAKAKFDNGILEVTLPKVEKVTKHQIKVES
mgnify:CR=1 FL=1